MNLESFKTALLAQDDIDDILFIEPVERSKSGEPIIYTTEKGVTFQKFDAHVVGSIQGVKNSFTVPFGVYNLGKADETVERLRYQAPVEKTVSAIETYIKSLPFVGIRNLAIDAEKLEASFDAIQVTGANAGKAVRVFAYKPAANPPTYLILS